MSRFGLIISYGAFCLGNSRLWNSVSGFASSYQKALAVLVNLRLLHLNLEDPFFYIFLSLSLQPPWRWLWISIYRLINAPPPALRSADVILGYRSLDLNSEFSPIWTSCSIHLCMYSSPLHLVFTVKTIISSVTNIFPELACDIVFDFLPQVPSTISTRLQQLSVPFSLCWR